MLALASLIFAACGTSTKKDTLLNSTKIIQSNDKRKSADTVTVNLASDSNLTFVDSTVLLKFSNIFPITDVHGFCTDHAIVFRTYDSINFFKPFTLYRNNRDEIWCYYTSQDTDGKLNEHLCSVNNPRLLDTNEFKIKNKKLPDNLKVIRLEDDLYLIYPNTAKANKLIAVFDKWKIN